jgi:hypothetical protein
VCGTRQIHTIDTQQLIASLQLTTRIGWSTGQNERHINALSVFAAHNVEAQSGSTLLNDYCPWFPVSKKKPNKNGNYKLTIVTQLAPTTSSCCYGNSINALVLFLFLSVHSKTILRKAKKKKTNDVSCSIVNLFNGRTQKEFIGVHSRHTMRFYDKTDCDRRQTVS